MKKSVDFSNRLYYAAGNMAVAPLNNAQLSGLFFELSN